jgi:hypothetical protein
MFAEVSQRGGEKLVNVYIVAVVSNTGSIWACFLPGCALCEGKNDFFFLILPLREISQNDWNVLSSRPGSVNFWSPGFLLPALLLCCVDR